MSDYVTNPIARRAVACPRFRWMEGMRALEADAAPDESDVVTVLRVEYRPGPDGYRLTGYLHGAGWNAWRVTPDGRWDDERAGDCGVSVPDLSDPCTVGGLLALVKKAWGSTAHLVRLPTRDLVDGEMVPACWWALATGLASVPLLLPDTDGHGHYLAGPTEAEALVAALEAAPHAD